MKRQPKNFDDLAARLNTVTQGGPLAAPAAASVDQRSVPGTNRPRGRPQKEPMVALNLRVPESIYRHLLAAAGEKSTGTGKQVTVQQVINDMLEKSYG